jgi:hypothetical protein
MKANGGLFAVFDTHALSSSTIAIYHISTAFTCIASNDRTNLQTNCFELD